jgi:hypothetical protein
LENLPLLFAFVSCLFTQFRSASISRPSLASGLLLCASVCLASVSRSLALVCRARGAKIYAEILGGSYTCDAHHMTEPNPTGDGVAHCITLALEDAGVDASEVQATTSIRNCVHTQLCLVA